MFKRVKIDEYERALLFREGRYLRLLDPGCHWIRGEVVRVDLRRRDTMVDAAPVLTRDLVSVGVRLLVTYRVTNPEKAILQSYEYRAHLANDAIVATHRAVSTVPLADLAAEHNRLEREIQDRVALEAASCGLRVEELAVIQLRFPRAIRKKLKRREVPGVP
jgi:regulator of protease activity HflC (stomatin/prohibitin superfamily)